MTYLRHHVAIALLWLIVQATNVLGVMHRACQRGALVLERWAKSVYEWMIREEA